MTDVQASLEEYRGRREALEAALPVPRRLGASRHLGRVGRLARRYASQYLDGDKVGEGRVEHTMPMLFSGDETTDLGRDSATPLSDDHGTDNGFTGRVLWVQIDIDDAAEDLDHLISAEERLRVAMARQ